MVVGFMPSLWRYHNVDGTSDHFRRGISVQALGTLIPARHHRVERRCDNGVVGRVDEGCEKLRLLRQRLRTNVGHAELLAGVPQLFGQHLEFGTGRRRVFAQAHGLLAKRRGVFALQNRGFLTSESHLTIGGAGLASRDGGLSCTQRLFSGRARFLGRSTRRRFRIPVPHDNAVSDSRVFRCAVRRRQGLRSPPGNLDTAESSEKAATICPNPRRHNATHELWVLRVAAIV
jgi:hypothetical protein